MVLFDALRLNFTFVIVLSDHIVSMFEHLPDLIIVSFDKDLHLVIPITVKSSIKQRRTLSGITYFEFLYVIHD